MDNTAKSKKGFKMPHVFVIMLIIMLFVSILTYIVPAGNFTRTTDPNSGRPIVEPGSYQQVEKTPVGFFDYFTSIYKGFVEGATIMGSLLLCSGALEILSHTGAFNGGIYKLISKAKGKEFVVVTIFYIIFTVFGVLGFGEASYPFYAIVVGVFMSMGYDRMVGTAIVMLGSTAGFTAGLVNMFTTGISQQIVGLPLYSGIGYRIIGLVVFFLIGFFFLWHYCSKIKKDPSRSLCREEYLEQQSKSVEVRETVEFTKKRMIALFIFLALIAVQVYCALNFGWGLGEISGLYMIYAIVLVILFRINMNEACQIFVRGSGKVLGAALAIGLGRSVMVLLTKGNILDTFVNGMANMLTGKSVMLTLLIIFLFVTVFNFFIGSGSGKAVMVMPILSPLGNLLGINQQVLVLAYQYGDGITNCFWPSGALVGLSLCDLDYGKWFKFAWKPYALISAAAYILIVIADKINFGPF